MSQETTYLELSEDDGGSHKFYEVTVDGTELTIRYGRIGDAGPGKTQRSPTTPKARAAAAKKIGEKVRKGYAPAVRACGQARRSPGAPIVSTRSTAQHRRRCCGATARGAPAFGIFVDERALHGRQRGRR